MKQKVFCIGFHKTGTTSLELALKRLGYRVTGSFGTKDPDIANKVHEKAYAMVAKFDAFEDNPWPILYKELDQRFPARSKAASSRMPACCGTSSDDAAWKSRATARRLPGSSA